MTYGYRGNFIAVLNKLVIENDNLTIGEILREGLRKVNLEHGNYIKATDESIYTIFENIKLVEDMQDEILSDEEFRFWVESKNCK